MISDLSTAGALPALEKMFLFSGQRQRLIAQNIANIDTPNYQGVDADPVAFQRALGQAIDKRKAKNGGASGELDLSRSSEVRMVGGRMQIGTIETWKCSCRTWWKTPPCSGSQVT